MIIPKNFDFDLAIKDINEACNELNELLKGYQKKDDAHLLVEELIRETLSTASDIAVDLILIQKMRSERKTIK